MKKLQAYRLSLSIRDEYLCKAPFSSLYIQPDGAMLPCCVYDRKLNWGYYPTSTINDALKSTSRKKLQRKIKSDSLKFGCFICEHAIENNNFEGAIARQYEKQTIDIKYPHKLEFELSHHCNLDCIMCGTHNHSESNIIFDNEQFLTDIDPYLYKVKQCSFYGGEPFLNQVYFKLWDRLIEINPQCAIYIQTNGTICNEKVWHVISHKNLRLGVSLDSLNETNFSTIRTGGNLSMVVENIKKFNTLMVSTERYLNVSVCPMPLNATELCDIFDFANSLHAEIFFNTVNFPRNLSFARRPSNELFLFSTLLGNDTARSSDNPRYGTNKKRFDSLKEMIQQYAERNRVFEHTIQSQTRDEFIVALCKWLRIKKQTDLLLELFNESKTEIIDPVVIGDIRAMGLPVLKKSITHYLEIKDYETIKKIFAFD